MKRRRKRLVVGQQTQRVGCVPAKVAGFETRHRVAGHRVCELKDGELERIVAPPGVHAEALAYKMLRVDDDAAVKHAAVDITDALKRRRQDVNLSVLAVHDVQTAIWARRHTFHDTRFGQAVPRDVPQRAVSHAVHAQVHPGDAVVRRDDVPAVPRDRERGVLPDGNDARLLGTQAAAKKARHRAGEHAVTGARVAGAAAQHAKVNPAQRCSDGFLFRRRRRARRQRSSLGKRRDSTQEAQTNRAAGPRQRRGKGDVLLHRSARQKSQNSTGQMEIFILVVFFGTMSVEIKAGAAKASLTLLCGGGFASACAHARRPPETHREM